MSIDAILARGPWDGVPVASLRKLYLAIDEGVSAPATAAGLSGDAAVKAFKLLRGAGLIRRRGATWKVA